MAIGIAAHKSASHKEPLQFCPVKNRLSGFCGQSFKYTTSQPQEVLMAYNNHLTVLSYTAISQSKISLASTVHTNISQLQFSPLFSVTRTFASTSSNTASTHTAMKYIINSQTDALTLCFFFCDSSASSSSCRTMTRLDSCWLRKDRLSTSCWYFLDHCSFSFTSSCQTYRYNNNIHCP